MAGKKGLKKRIWSDDEKRRICAQTMTPDVSVAQVARRYAMNANLIFKWLKDPRFVPVGSCNVVEESSALEGVFLPVEVGPSEMESPAVPEPMLPISADPTSQVMAQRVDIALSDGRRLLLEGPTSLLSVVGLVQGLTA